MIKSYYSSSFLQFLTILLIFSSSSSIIIRADVSPSKRFSYDLKDDSFHVSVDETEYSVWYRALPIKNYPFSLYFYQTNDESSTGNGFHKPEFGVHTYILAIGMGDLNPTTRWVWEANLNHPVGEKAKLLFSRRGNLALINGDGRIVWQTRTSNKGVVDIKLLPNGNLVLLDRNGGFVWQSFYHPTNTLLIGQGLGPGSSTTNKIANGKYSMVLQDKALRLFFDPNPKSSRLSSKPFTYYKVSPLMELGVNITFDTIIDPDYFDELIMFTGSGTDSLFYLANPRFNSTWSMLRLSSNGNLYIYTYLDLPGDGNNVWVETYASFSKKERSECFLPEKCGSFGLCEDHQCVACPTPKGLLGWDNKCKLPKIPSCNASTVSNVGYYRVKDAEDYRPLGDSDGEGPMTVSECMKKCNDDCKCVGFFYRNRESMCSLAAQINTLAKRDAIFEGLIDAYVKYAK
ncbi:hypothetical protein MKX01_027466 [Papaver californicum]|nr:hypothetical protein MKX01_027466 [Papaver californicum]